VFKGVLTQNQYQIKKFRGANSMKQIYSIQKLSLIFKVYIAMLFIVFSELQYTELEYLPFGNVYRRDLAIRGLSIRGFAYSRLGFCS